MNLISPGARLFKSANCSLIGLRKSSSRLSVLLGWQAILVEVDVSLNGGSYWDGTPYRLCQSSWQVTLLCVFVGNVCEPSNRDHGGARSQDDLIPASIPEKYDFGVS